MIEQLKQSTLGRLAMRYIASDPGTHAPVIAYNALFSVFPILLASLTVLGRIAAGPAVLAQMTDLIYHFFPSDAASVMTEVLRGTREQSGLLGLLSILGLLWAGSMLFGALAKAFNRIYEVPDRPLIREKIMSVSMIFLFAILLLLSVAATTTAQLLIQLTALPIAEMPALTVVSSIAAFLVSLAAAIVLFLVIYLVVPNVKHHVGNVWPGALLAGGLFVLLLQVFPLYARFFGNFSRFGALFGFSFLLLTWLYFVAQVILVGVTLNAVLLRSKAQPRAA